MGFYFTGDPYTGMFKPAENKLAFETQGLTRMHVDNYGNVGIGVPFPAGALHVGGDVICSDGGAFVGLGHDSLSSSNASSGAPPRRPPAYTFRGDLGTGVYNPAAGSVGISTAGRERILVRGDSNGSVGVGDFALDLPQQALDVRGNIQASDQVLMPTKDDPSAPSYSWTDNSGCGLYSPYPDTVSVSTSNTERVRVTSKGELRAFGDIVSYGDIRQQSDVRVKGDVRPLEESLDTVLRLRGCSYERTDDDTKKHECGRGKFDGPPRRRRRQLGVIAQEVGAVVPELVSSSSDGASQGNEGGRLAVSYNGIVALLVEAVKAMNASWEQRFRRLEDAFTARENDRT